MGAGRGEERTENMYCMVVTLEVSKLSGWLNALAPCREPKGVHTMRRRGAARRGGGASRMQGGHRLEVIKRHAP